MPYTLYVDNQPAPASGLTMITWIYPLDDQPPQWFGTPLDEPESTQNQP